jgi:hypothetical protein
VARLRDEIVLKAKVLGLHVQGAERLRSATLWSGFAAKWQHFRRVFGDDAKRCTPELCFHGTGRHNLGTDTKSKWIPHLEYLVSPL